MPHATCAHCGTPITDHSTLVEHEGRTYCCNNCLQMVSGTAQPAPGRATCAHCQMPILDASTQAERDGQTFCCNNCATAMVQGAGHS